MIFLKRCFQSSIKMALTKVRTMASSSFASAAEKFEKGLYAVSYIPGVLFMDYTGVYVNESAPYPDIVEALERRKRRDPEIDNVLTPKLKATSYGDWFSRVILLHSGYFASRERLDDILIRTDKRKVGPQCISASRISLQSALKAMRVELSINMKYYKENLTEIDTDLGYKVTDSVDFNNDLAVRKLEQELFYKMMCKLCGNENADDHIEVDGKEILFDKTYMIRDFSILSFGDNSMMATATRDDYYMVLLLDY